MQGLERGVGGEERERPGGGCGGLGQWYMHAKLHQGKTSVAKDFAGPGVGWTYALLIREMPSSNRCPMSPTTGAVAAFALQKEGRGVGHETPCGQVLSRVGEGAESFMSCWVYADAACGMHHDLAPYAWMQQEETPHPNKTLTKCGWPTKEQHNRRACGISSESQQMPIFLIKNQWECLAEWDTLLGGPCKEKGKGGRGATGHAGLA